LHISWPLEYHEWDDEGEGKVMSLPTGGWRQRKSEVILERSGPVFGSAFFIAKTNKSSDFLSILN